MDGGALTRATRGLLGAAALVAALRSAACTTEAVVGVTIVEIGVQPSAAVVERNDSIRLSAIVRDDQGAVLEDARVTWASDRPSVVSVSSDGLVSALRVGPATVTATLGEVAGEARITVISDGTLVADPPEVEFSAGILGRRPDPVDVQVRDAGGGRLDDVDVDVDYDPGTPREWLDVDDRRRGDHFVLEVRADARGFSPGSYQATILVTAPDFPGDELAVPITLTIAGILVLESDGETVVGTDVPSDQLSVALEPAPRSEVVLDVASSDPEITRVSPERLSFGVADWNERQIVTVSTGSAGPVGSGEAEIRIEVDRTRSDPGFHAVDPVRVPVTVAGPAAGIRVTETGGDTAAREGDVDDVLRVSLASRPASDVIVNVSASDRDDARVRPSELRFRPAEWSSEQEVSFHAVNDRADDGDRTQRIIFSADERSDEAYVGVPPVVIEARTFDDDRGNGGRGGGNGGDDEEDSNGGRGRGNGGDGDDNRGPGGDDEDNG